MKAGEREALVDPRESALGPPRALARERRLLRARAVGPRPIGIDGLRAASGLMGTAWSKLDAAEHGGLSGRPGTPRHADRRERVLPVAGRDVGDQKRQPGAFLDVTVGGCDFSEEPRRVPLETGQPGGGEGKLLGEVL